jgi:protein-arginine kinase activator protein McsA
MVTIPAKSLGALKQFLDEHEVVFAKYKVRKIKSAVANELNRVDLFKAEDNSIMAWVAEEDYLQSLESALKVLVREEEYEYAAKTRKVMDTIQINNLIKETAKPEE